MAEKQITMLSEGDPYLSLSPATVHVELGDGRDAWYAAPNIFALETWQRYDNKSLAGYIQDKGEALQVVGRFASLAALRDTYETGATNAAHYLEHITALEEADAAAERDELGWKAETTGLMSTKEISTEYIRIADVLEQHSPVIQSAQIAALRFFSVLATEKGMDASLVEELSEAVMDEVRAVEPEQHVHEVFEAHIQEMERAFFLLFGQENDASNLYTLLDWFEACSQPPYTFSITAQEVENIEAAIDMHRPRTKISIDVVRSALQETLAMLDRFGYTALYGEPVVSSEGLEYARAIAEGR